MENPPVLSMESPRVILMRDAPIDGYLFRDEVGECIAHLAGVSVEELEHAFDLRGVFDERPLFDRKIPPQVAQYVCDLILPTLHGRYVLFYGRALALAFGFTPDRPLQWHSASYTPEDETHFAFAVIPNFDDEDDPLWSQWWKRLEGIDEATEFLAALVHPGIRGSCDP